MKADTLKIIEKYSYKIIYIPSQASQPSQKKCTS